VGEGTEGRIEDSRRDRPREDQVHGIDAKDAALSQQGCEAGRENYPDDQRHGSSVLGKIVGSRSWGK
jgi:hypothetical protein